MSKISLDLSKFSHVKTEKGMTTLKHKDGHELKVAHKSLSPEFQKQLSALSRIPQEAATVSQKDEMQHKMADGGKVNKSTDQEKPAEQGEIPKTDETPIAIHATPGRLPPKPEKKAEGGVVDEWKHTQSRQGTIDPVETHEHEHHGRIQGNHNLGYTAKSKHGMTATQHASLDEAKAHLREKFKKFGYSEGGTVENPKLDPDKAADAQRGAQQSGTKSISETFHNVMKGTGLEADPQYEKEHKAEGGEVKTFKHGQDVYHKLHGHGKVLEHDAKTKHTLVQVGSATGSPKPQTQTWIASHELEKYAQGGDVQQYAEGTDNVQPVDTQGANFVPPAAPPQQPESISQAPRGDLPPIASVPEKTIPSTDNPYKIAYDKAFQTAKSFGMPDEEANRHAMLMTREQQGLDEARLQGRVREQKTIHDQAEAENVQRQKMGLPLVNVPEATIPGAPMASGQEQTQAQPQAPGPGPQADIPPQAPFQPGQKPDDYGTSEYGNMMQKGFQQELAGINQGAQAQGELGQARADIHQQQANQQQEAQQHYVHVYNDLMGERQNMIDDIRQGYIDPEKYWDTHSKIGTGIGMILAGFNPTSNPNAATNFLKFQMEQNLNAQRENLGAKQNLLRANLAQFGEARMATDMTRIMQNDIVAHQLEAAAGKAASPLAKAAALQAAGQLRMQTAPAFQQLALRQAIMRISSQGGSPGAVDQLLGQLRMFNPEMAKEIESRYVPGIGVAKVPVPQGARDSMTAFSNVDKLINEALTMANTPYTAMSPAQRMRGQTLMGELQSQIRTAEDQGVYKESEANFMKKLLGDNPAGFFAKIRTEPKLMEMQHIKQNEHKALRNQYGLPSDNMVAPYQQPQQRQVVNIKGKPHTIQTINGKQYYVPVQR